jgi:NAD(P)-dependent dehydrogenase (short-subunit alcohol dehydrogenase family)
MADPAEIARIALFLVRDATYMTGRDIVADGGSMFAG